jgi:RNA recognition motif-containing protein
VTDLQLKYTKEGKFRGFAFVGYRTEEEANAARNYFNGTYIGAAKIDVRTCTDLGDQKNSKEEKMKLLRFLIIFVVTLRATYLELELPYGFSTLFSGAWELFLFRNF